MLNSVRSNPMLDLLDRIKGAPAPEVGGGDPLEQLVRALVEEARAAREERRAGAGFGQEQDRMRRAHAVFGATPATGRAATQAMVRRHGVLKAHGIDPDAPWVRGIVADPDDKTGEKYVADVRAAQAAYEARRKERRAKLAANPPKKGDYKHGKFYAVRAETADPRSAARRSIDAREFAQGRRTPGPDYEMRDAEYDIAHAGSAPLPPKEHSYRAFYGEGGAPLQDLGEFPTADEASAAAHAAPGVRSLEEARRMIEALRRETAARRGIRPYPALQGLNDLNQ